MPARLQQQRISRFLLGLSQEEWRPAADATTLDIMEAILGGRPPADLQLEDSLTGFQVGWQKHRAEILGL
jgi:hypothetical protein